jgi:hypothetical protein
MLIFLLLQIHSNIVPGSEPEKSKGTENLLCATTDACTLPNNTVGGLLPKACFA